MLEQLIVRDFALSHENTVDFKAGMTSITGETGAGKSLTVDALDLVLGGRASADSVRQGAPKAEIEACFDIAAAAALKERLKELELLNEDDAGSLYLRRVIGADGKSKAYVNGRLSTVAVLKELGSGLIAIHGQHAGIKLIEDANQLKLLDAYAHAAQSVTGVNAAFESYNKERLHLSALSEEQVNGAAGFKTLRFEQDALKKLDLEAGDYERISERYDALTHAQQSEDAIALALAVLDSDEHNVIEILNARLSDLIKVKAFNEAGLTPVIENFTAALTSLDGARTALGSLNSAADPRELDEISEKLSKCHELASRFGVQPKDLYKIQTSLEEKLEHFLALKDEIAALTQKVKTLRQDYENKAMELSKIRAAAAQAMSAAVTEKIRMLAMPDGVFEVKIARDEEMRPRRDGRDNVSFLFSANLGQEPRTLEAVASGGELSRLALAIEVLTASENSTPTLIFDEVDTGISGRTASAVGDLLRELGAHSQIITVTHLPQVAASADHQLLVSKENQGSGVTSKVTELDEASRCGEIARMMGGSVVTEATLESARALLSHSGRTPA